MNRDGTLLVPKTDTVSAGGVLPDGVCRSCRMPRGTRLGTAWANGARFFLVTLVFYGWLAAKEMGGSLTAYSDGPGGAQRSLWNFPSATREKAHEHDQSNRAASRLVLTTIRPFTRISGKSFAQMTTRIGDGENRNGSVWRSPIQGTRPRSKSTLRFKVRRGWKRCVRPLKPDGPMPWLLLISACPPGGTVLRRSSTSGKSPPTCRSSSARRTPITPGKQSSKTWASPTTWSSLKNHCTTSQRSHWRALAKNWGLDRQVNAGSSNWPGGEPANAGVADRQRRLERKR